MCLTSLSNKIKSRNSVFKYIVTIRYLDELHALNVREGAFSGFRHVKSKFD